MSSPEPCHNTKIKIDSEIQFQIIQKQLQVLLLHPHSLTLIHSRTYIHAHAHAHAHTHSFFSLTPSSSSSSSSSTFFTTFFSSLLPLSEVGSRLSVSVGFRDIVTHSLTHTHSAAYCATLLLCNGQQRSDIFVHCIFFLSTIHHCHWCVV
jgi:hypothetical protein